MKFLLTTLALFSYSLVFTQIKTFDHFLDVHKDVWGYSVFEEKDGYVVFASSLGSNSLIFVKLDFEGNTIWEKVLDFSSDLNFKLNSSEACIQVDSVNYAVTIEVFTETFENTHLALVMFSSEKQDTLWMKKYPLKDINIPTAIRQTKEKGFLIFYEKTSIVYRPDSTYYFDKSHLGFTKVDSTGNFLFEKIIADTLEFSKSAQMELLENGEVFITYTGGENWFADEWFFGILDTALNPKWIKMFNLNYSVPISCSIIGDSLFLIGGAPLLENEPGVWTVPGRVYAFNYLGESIRLTKLEADPSVFEIRQIRATPTGEILGCGWHKVTMGRVGTGRVFKLDHKGEILWDKDFWDGDERSEGYFLDLIETSDGDVLVTGIQMHSSENTPPNGFVGDIWLLKLDSMGCLHSDCGDLITVPTKNIPNLQKANSFTFSPNPTSGKLLLTSKNPITESGSIIFYNALGQKILEQRAEKNNVEFSIDLTEKTAGIYFVVFKTEEGQIDLGKVVVE